jgi:prophage regulatory protein
VFGATEVQRKFLSLAETAAYVGVGKSTVLRWEAAGIFPRRVRLGPGRVAWRLEDLEQWAAEREPVVTVEGPQA